MIEMMEEYFLYLQKDFIEVVGYVLPGLLVGLLGSLVILMINRIRIKVWDWKRIIPVFLFWTYITVVAQITYFSRQPGSRTDVAFGLWDTWGTTVQAHAYVIENVILFIPFGILLPMCGECGRKFCLPFALCESLLIEGMQFLAKRGYCQLDDVVTNVIGAAIGYLIYWIIFGWNRVRIDKN